MGNFHANSATGPHQRLIHYSCGHARNVRISGTWTEGIDRHANAAARGVCEQCVRSEGGKKAWATRKRKA